MGLEKRNAENAIQRRLESEVSLILQRVTPISNWYALSIRNAGAGFTVRSCAADAAPPIVKRVAIEARALSSVRYEFVAIRRGTRNDFAGVKRVSNRTMLRLEMVFTSAEPESCASEVAQVEARQTAACCSVVLIRSPLTPAAMSSGFAILFLLFFLGSESLAGQRSWALWRARHEQNSTLEGN
jgi:hypothetical protein